MSSDPSNGFVPEGTGFICLARYEDMSSPVVVTAAHVFNAIPRNQLAIRVNRKSGGAESLKIKEDCQVIGFKNLAIDLVAFPAALDPTVYDVAGTPLDREQWKTEFQKTGTEPAPGDEIAIVGLYTSHYGRLRNIPVLRIGHIAAPFEEEVATHRGYVKALLIEVHSIAGLSGSPVFWQAPTARVTNGNVQVVNPSQIIMGVLIGYHTTKTRGEEIEVSRLQTIEIINAESERPNEKEDLKWADENKTGFGVVLPMHFIFSAFESEQMKKILEKSVTEFRQDLGYKDASAGFFSQPVPSATQTGA
jgi:hypothetical protein